MTHDDRIRPSAARDLAARLAELKLEALERDADGTWTPHPHEEDVIADAARGLARRSARRAAMADAVTWESAASPESSVPCHDGSNETAVVDHLRALLELAGPTASDPLDEGFVWDCGHVHDQGS